MSHNANVIRGHKAAIANPNVSEEAKERSRHVIEELGGEVTPVQPSIHVLGGYKATLHNPHTSSEAKEHAREVLDTHDEHGQPLKHSSTAGTEHDHRVLGGYKATLKNPNVSQGAKEHAIEVLEDADAY